MSRRSDAQIADDLVYVLERALDYMRRHGDRGHEHLQIAQDADELIEEWRDEGTEAES